MHRITFFVESAEHREERTQVVGEVGLGPISRGDVFSFVHRPESGEDLDVRAVVEEVGEGRLDLRVAPAVELRRGDILGGEIPVRRA